MQPQLSHVTLDLLAAARLMAADSRPYFQFALISLQPIPAPDMPAPMGVDRWWRLYVHEERLAKYTIPEVSGILLHEIGHLLQEHPDRCDMMHADPTLWNIAGDIALNKPLIDSGTVLPADALLPATFGLEEGKLTEEYYEELYKKAKKVVIKVPGPAAGMCGSGAGGPQQPHELGEPGTGNDPRLGDAPGRDQLEADMIRRQVAQDVLEASKTRGNVPAGWERWAKETLKPQIPWQRELPAAIRSAYAEIAGMCDYSYTKPNRRQAAFGRVVMPSLKAPLPQVGVLVDTSGSMNDHSQAQALAEIGGVLATTGGRKTVHVWSCDAMVHTTQKVMRKEAVKLAGGGGTDMRVGIAAAEAVKPKLDMLVIFTDQYTPWPEVRPQIRKIIIAAVGDGESPQWDCKVIKIHD